MKSSEFFKKRNYNMSDDMHNLYIALIELAISSWKAGEKDNSRKTIKFICENLLRPQYDVQKAIDINKNFFTERDRITTFSIKNMEKIKKQVNSLSLRHNDLSSKIRVFTFWDGEENEIVRVCFNSMKRYINTELFEFVILNKDNINEWVDLSYLNGKKIPIQHYTDILRYELLSEYGGFWIDATCMLTQDLYQSTIAIRKYNFFFFSYSNTRVGTWFFWSKPNEYSTNLILESLKLWWEKEGVLTNYFMLHDFIEMLYWIDEDYKSEWDKISKIHPRNALAILNNYQKNISQEEFIRLKSNSFIHKLTYKYDKNKIPKNSSLNFVLNE